MVNAWLGSLGTAEHHAYKMVSSDHPDDGAGSVCVRETPHGTDYIQCTRLLSLQTAQPIQRVVLDEELLRLSCALRAMESVVPRRNLCSFRVDSVYFVAPRKKKAETHRQNTCL